ncbi:hypothetical protein BDW74DRAFT_171953 [Aspergillus multicolor]|uniref:uncharacterized protein n=1 Tax=Aspergillus multicolor TaxID=41759 RepID=UPI003CCD1BE8
MAPKHHLSAPSEGVRNSSRIKRMSDAVGSPRAQSPAQAQTPAQAQSFAQPQPSPRAQSAAQAQSSTEVNNPSFVSDIDATLADVRMEEEESKLATLVQAPVDEDKDEDMEDMPPARRGIGQGPDKDLLAEFSSHDNNPTGNHGPGFGNTGGYSYDDDAMIASALQDKEYAKAFAEDNSDCDAPFELDTEFMQRPPVDTDIGLSPGKSLFELVIPPGMPAEPSELDGNHAAATGIGLVHDKALFELDIPPGAPAEPSELVGLPLAWAENTQGGMYTKKGFFYGLLLGKNGGIRCRVDEKDIYTRVAGGMNETENGVTTQMRDQAVTDSEVYSVLNSASNHVAIGVVIDRLCPDVRPSRAFPHKYCVLGEYRIIAVWWEKIDGKRAFRVRLQRVDFTKKPWFARKDSPDLVDPAQSGVEPIYKKCQSCEEVSFQVYALGWICLNATCDKFWQFEDGSEPPVHMAFCPLFLAYSPTRDPETQMKYSLVPTMQSSISIDPLAQHIRSNWKQGWVCVWCRRCVSRCYYDGWVCESTGRGADYEGDCPGQGRLMAEVPVLPLRAVLTEPQLAPLKRPFLIHNFGPKPKDSWWMLCPTSIDDYACPPYRMVCYDLKSAGNVVCFVSNREINAQLNGPDALFTRLQQDQKQLKLKRYPLERTVASGTLTSEFAANFGMPYDFNVKIPSTSFKDTPESLRHVVGRLKWAVERVQAAYPMPSETAHPPNEVLLLTYIEGMAVNFHDDGEKVLGPDIASITLGSTGIFSIRLKLKWFKGFTETKKDGKKPLHPNIDPVLPGCANYDWRKELKERWDNGEMTLDEYNATWLEKHKQSKTVPTNRQVVIKYELNHGDIMVMQGAGIQKYYEHGAEMDENHPGTKLRFAITARHVLKSDKNEHIWHMGQYDSNLVPEYNGK